MRFLAIIFLALSIQGCKTFHQPTVYENEVTNSIVRNTKKFGLKLVSLIEAGKYKQAITLLEEKYKIVKSDITKEDFFFLELKHLQFTRRAIASNVSLLQDTHPNNLMSNLISGYYLSAKAREARGGKWAHLTSESQFNEMIKIQNRAIQYLLKVLEIDSGNYFAHLELGNIYKTSKGDFYKSQLHFLEAKKIKPNSYWVWADYLTSITPRWGGSYPLMSKNINEMAAYITQNKNLEILKSSIIVDKASLAEYKGNYSIAISMYKDALKFGNDHRVLIGLGYSNNQLGNYTEGCKYIRLAVKQRPFYPRYITNHIICEKKGM